MKWFDDPEPGNVLIVGLGGAAAFYVIDRDEDVHRRMVQFLPGTDFAGVIFSRLPMPGTFPLAQVRLDTAKAAPDIVISMRWNADKNWANVAQR